MTTNESNQSSIYDWVQDMTVPLKPIENDLLNRQYCSEPESLHDQINKEFEKQNIMISEQKLIREFIEKYPNAYKSYIEHQRWQLIKFIKGWKE